MKMVRYNRGDTWEYIDPKNGNHGMVWLQEIYRGVRKTLYLWYFAVAYEDGSTPDGSFDWMPSKAEAVYQASVKLAGMGSRKTRFKFNPALKFGEPIKQD
jgi:hypothetical protein